ncbi:flavin reductase family protein [Nonomuraea sp. PA05]|uniref:flavin reductase family protein n=1 Tax=Nonomuraea sp. PA05 TaxID=2604466 RepID=UPI0011DA8ED2|nr:flavin reductase family protein [Nonomuraea sp. PA05]TYB56629.1 flavin reductase family protein [Nonomuraea sp. PA05]
MRALREAFGQFATGVAVVTTVTGGGERAGVTVNSFTSVSLDPPLVLWCLSDRAPSAPLFLRAGRFAVNVLAADQDHLSRRFATPAADKFAGVELAGGPTLGTPPLGTPLPASPPLGSPPLPVLAGALATFVCRTERVHDGGDHHIFVGAVERYQRADGEPLVFHAGRYREFWPGPALARPA